MKTTSTIIGLLFFFVFSLQAEDLTSLLEELDQTLLRRTAYIHEKESKIEQLKQNLQSARTQKEQYDKLGELFDEYTGFNADSSFYIAKTRYNIALEMGDSASLQIARTNMAETFGMAGMFKEALDMIREVEPQYFTPDMFNHYYHVCRTIYGLMGNYAVTERQQEEYAHMTDLYRDSILQTTPPESFTYHLVKADQYNSRKEYDKAIQLLSDYNEHFKCTLHEKAVSSYTLAESYRLNRDTENEKKYLLLSAIADMKSGIREYISLRQLSLLLYQEGDIERAHSYLKLCMEDASLCNARLRIVEILQIFPLINETYLAKEQKQQSQLKSFLFCISLLSIFLALTIFYIYRQMKKLALARQQMEEFNLRLQELNEEQKELNEELNRSNKHLREAYHSIAENSYIKEEYIGRYMDQCSAYIEKMDEYRRTLGKIAATGKVEDLYKKIKSTEWIENELKDFYSNFDETFLHLFPSFVEEFNTLLTENEQIRLKPGERMNTELRIFALIRLGITDSVKIAQFLRYSVTTIYNYRTKTRNKAAVKRDEFEKNVMTIGKINS